MNNPDSTIQVLSDSIKTLNYHHTFWYNFRTLDVNVLIIIAIALSSLATIFITLRLHRKSYKEEYYKRVIALRLETYLLIEKLLGEMLITVVPLDGKPYSKVLGTWLNYQAFYHEIGKILNKIFWLNNDLAAEIIDLNKYLNKTFSIDNQIPDAELIKLACDNYGKMGDFLLKIHDHFMDNMLTLDNVKHFFNEKKTTIPKAFLIKLTSKN